MKGRHGTLVIYSLTLSLREQIGLLVSAQTHGPTGTHCYFMEFLIHAGRILMCTSELNFISWCVKSSSLPASSLLHVKRLEAHKTQHLQMNKLTCSFHSIYTHAIKENHMKTSLQYLYCIRWFQTIKPVIFECCHVFDGATIEVAIITTCRDINEHFSAGRMQQVI